MIIMAVYPRAAADRTGSGAGDCRNVKVNTHRRMVIVKGGD